MGLGLMGGLAAVNPAMLAVAAAAYAAAAALKVIGAERSKQVVPVYGGRSATTPGQQDYYSKSCQVDALQDAFVDYL